jgi:predicted NAD/FAD-binding protein
MGGGRLVIRSGSSDVGCPNDLGTFIMPFDRMDRLRPREVAVIGSGISGMAAAWLLSSHHRVTVYEKESRIGGHSNTVEVPGPEGPIAVDTGFIVYNEINYPNLVALFRHLGVPTKASQMSFAASIDDGALEYCSSGLGGLFAQPMNLARPRFWRMLADIRRFYRNGARLLDHSDADQFSLGEYLDRERYSHAFVYNHLLPMGAAIWSTAMLDMRDHPAAAFIRFFQNHCLLQVGGRPRWRTVDGGSREYVRRLTHAYADRILVGTPVRSVRRTGNGVVVVDGGGRSRRFDDVVIAAHADEALAMLADPSPAERELLSAFRYTNNRAVLHSDPSLMPKRRRVWSSWNYLCGSSADPARQVCISYWMNRLQDLDRRLQVFVTLNPHRDPKPSEVFRVFDYAHPSFDRDSIATQKRLWQLQGRQRTWFCGSYFGAGFHEDGLQAGLAVAEALGGLRRPWNVPGASARIFVANEAAAAVPAE